MNGVVERKIMSDITAPDIGTDEANARVIHFIRDQVPLSASQLVESLGTSRPEQVSVRTFQALHADEMAQLYDFGEHCGRAGSFFSLDIVISETGVDAPLPGTDENKLRRIIETTRVAVRDSAVRWLILLQSELMSQLPEIWSLARENHADPLLVLPEMIGLESRRDPASDKLAHEFISRFVLSSENPVETHRTYYEGLAEFLSSTNAVPRPSATILEMRDPESGKRPGAKFNLFNWLRR